MSTVAAAAARLAPHERNKRTASTRRRRSRLGDLCTTRALKMLAPIEHDLGEEFDDDISLSDENDHQYHHRKKKNSIKRRAFLMNGVAASVVVVARESSSAAFIDTLPAFAADDVDEGEDILTTKGDRAKEEEEEEEERGRERGEEKEEEKQIPLTKITRESLAFTFAYPTETVSGKPIPWSESRVRETYSSSEPMSPDARQRIVHELISFKGPLTTVVTVGELPPRLLNKPESEWTAKSVANAILADKATGRVASGQKISLAEVDNARKEEKEDGTQYYYYEYISQGSPNSKEGEATTYRHGLGVTTVRDGFAYTVTMNTPERFWDEMNLGFEQSIRAFTLETPTKKYRKPGDEGLDILHVFD